ncbi:MAG TPA: lipase family protein [Longimicrobium sp.]|nr:lipase family protein [Longimicrobium sp.]
MDAAIIPPTPYDHATAQFLSNVALLANEQYDNPSWNGDIPADLVPAGYTQIAKFQVPNLDLNKAVDAFLTAHPELHPLVHTDAALVDADVDALVDAEIEVLNTHLSNALEDPATLSLIAAAAAPPQHLADFTPAWFGFALAPTSDNLTGSNIVAFRGTRTAIEWVVDAAAVQVPVPLVWFSDGKLKIARVHLGFLIWFAFVKPQVDAAVLKFNPNAVSTQTTGHSLGAAIATLTSIYLKLGSPLTPVQSYPLASPRVGDRTFASAYDFYVPSTFRIVNLTDWVPVVPPTSLTIVVHGVTVSVQNTHVGQEWSYLWQTGDLNTNHSLKINYNPAIIANVATDAARTYPNTGVPC